MLPFLSQQHSEGVQEQVRHIKAPAPEGQAEECPPAGGG